MLRFISVICATAAIVIAFWFEPSSDTQSLVAGDPNTADKRILFIGNSFTFFGNVPLQVKHIAASSDESVDYYTEMHVQGGTSLERHLAETDPITTIKSREWDVVVLQDASVMAFRPDWKADMEEAAEILAHAAQAQGAKVLYYAHWAPAQRYLGRDDVGADRLEDVLIIERAYKDLRGQVDGKVALAGRLWQMADYLGIEGLYHPDGHHPSVKGAYVAALAIGVALGDVDVETSRWAPNVVDSSEHEILLNLVGKLEAPELAAIN